MLKWLISHGLISSYLLLIGGAMMAHAAVAADNVRMHGALVHEACDIKPGDETQVLELGMISDRFLYLNSRTPSREIHLNLINCDTTIGNMVTLSFSGIENSDLPGYLAVDGSSSAKGIAIGIETTAGDLIPLNDTSGITKPVFDGANSIIFKGFLRAEPNALANHSITRGTFNAVTTFNLDYN